MTDSDTKERNALTSVWPDIELLMCLYHFSKACTNHMTKTLGHGGDGEQKALRNQMKAFIRQFRTRYLYSSLPLCLVPYLYVYFSACRRAFC
jgi:hypothetical protein